MIDMNVQKNTTISSFQIDDFAVNMINGFAQIIKTPKWAKIMIGKRYINLESAHKQIELMIDDRKISRHVLNVEDELMSIGIVPR
jgi:predicted RNA-binding protein